MGDHEKNQNPFWKKRIIKGLVPIWAAVAVLVLGALTALALFLARAEITGSVNVGDEVTLDWAQAGGVLEAYATEDTEGVWTFNTASLGDNNLDCVVEAVGGELQVTITGAWQPGEACGAGTDFGTSGDPFLLQNPNTLDVTNITFNFGTSDLGIEGDGAPVEVFVIDPNGTGSDFTETTLPSSLSAGTDAAMGFVFKIADDATTGTTLSLDGAAVEGEASRS